MSVYTGATAKTYFALTDHLGTVHAVADDTGAIVESYRFDAWGRVLGVYDSSGSPTGNQQSQIGNRFLWQGREYSWKTRFYFFRARWYDPITGRFLSNDPIGISGGLNMYILAGNCVTMFGDPFGLCTEVESGISDTTFDWITALTPIKIPLTGFVLGKLFGRTAEQTAIIAAREATLGETALKGVGEDMLVHFSQVVKRGSILDKGVLPSEGYSYFYRVGDVRNMTAAGARTAIGELAAGGAENSLAVVVSQNAGSFTRVPMPIPQYMTSQNSIPWTLIRQVPGGVP
jgi:RHS repeat-associated protein